MLTRHLSALAILACLGSPALAQSSAGQDADGGGAPQAAAMGQDPGPEAAGGGLQPAISTQLTFRSHSIAANSSAGNLEGNACPAPTRMISGACHPGYNDRVIIINQFPNTFANTWRCGFRNNNNVARTVWIYTVCAQ
jgi:hypothetical protein